MKIIEEFFICIVLPCLLIVSLFLMTGGVPRVPTEKLNANDAKEIFARLMRYSGLTNESPIKFTVEKSDTINANANDYDIVIYSGLIDFVQTKDGLAMLIAHEISHILLEHTLVEHSLPTEVLEGNADKMAIYLLLRAGYDPCRSGEFFKLSRDKEGDFEYNSDHPNYSHRIWQLDFPMCR